MRHNHPPLLVALLTVLGLATLLASPASAAANLSQRLARADQRFEQDYASMISKQDGHKAKYNRYWQGLPTHTTPPGAADKHPDRWFDRPTDQRGQGWDKFVSFATMPYSLRVDVYNGPAGDGWVMCAQTTDAGQVYERCQGDGGEDRNTSGWRLVGERP